MRVRWRWFVIGGGALAALAILYVALNPYILLIFFTKPLKPATPPLLVDAQAGDQLICPPHNADEAILARPPQAGSPQVESRLAKQFPAGSQVTRLVAALKAQGFTLVEVCDRPRNRGQDSATGWVHPARHG